MPNEVVMLADLGKTEACIIKTLLWIATTKPTPFACIFACKTYATHLWKVGRAVGDGGTP